MMTQEELNELWLELEEEDAGGDGYPIEQFEEELAKRGGGCLTGLYDPQDSDPYEGFLYFLKSHGWTVLEDPSGVDCYGNWVAFGPETASGAEDTKRVVSGKMRGVMNRVCTLIDDGLSIDEAIGGLQATISLLRELKEQQAQEEACAADESPTTSPTDRHMSSSLPLVGTSRAGEDCNRNGITGLREEGHLLPFTAPCPS